MTISLVASAVGASNPTHSQELGKEISDSVTWDKLVFLESPISYFDKVFDPEASAIRPLSSTLNGSVLSMSKGTDNCLLALVRDIDPSHKEPVFMLKIQSKEKRAELSVPQSLIFHISKHQKVLSRNNRIYCFTPLYISCFWNGKWVTQQLKRQKNLPEFVRSAANMKHAVSINAVQTKEACYFVFNCGEFGHGIIECDIDTGDWREVINVPTASFTEAQVDSEQNLWILTDQALYCWNGKCMKNVNGEFFPGDWPEFMSSTNSGKIFFATAKGSLYILRDMRTERIGELPPLTDYQRTRASQGAAKRLRSLIAISDKELLVQNADSSFSLFDLDSKQLKEVPNSERIFHL